ncbi:pyridoxal phosphate enzyme [Chloropicon primus]|uniref:Pyridoxal phosphate homeostasis protein n=1 Tax=Chloropicon primus TaxID=1764295 RepID=A0A5B8MIE1_9CHLO|nr:pyridoxal phosphate enzyme [Chloropicon primus]UPQ99361.1 pyridoxal phosphate enzyme [Chloropicon primus]|eukprot:QDZ20149.1 pyridoxal phosphate enzyme [Chloropicon primus]
MSVQARAQEPAAAAPAAQVSVAEGIKDVRRRIEAAAERSGNKAPRLVAVGKTKPLEMVLEAYHQGHRYFGENYVQEIVEKAASAPEDIHWHFIGHLQSNKAKALLQGVPNLSVLETVDTAKLADRLNRICGELGRDKPLGVMVQVNTSGEESKHGVEPAEATVLAAHITEKCPNLKLAGFMTIGMPDYTSKPENFVCLKDCRRRAAEQLGMDEAELELSMGMSGDFEAAIEMGSTNIRVGSTIFGARVYPNKK